jgi:AcrR family transcriptional regulator
MSAQERSEAIIQATVGLLIEKGLAATTTRDVTERAGVGVGLLNHYFGWAELRAIAFDRIVRADLERTLIARAADRAGQVMADLVEGAFLAAADPVWRLWIEASDLASSDAALAQRIGSCTEMWRQALADLLRRGVAAGEWSCDDPEGASWRLIALFDGLVGFVISPGSKLSRDAATALMRKAVSFECGVPGAGR